MIIEAIIYKLMLYLLQNMKTNVKLDVFKHIKEIMISIYIYIYIYCLKMFIILFINIYCFVHLINVQNI